MEHKTIWDSITLAIALDLLYDDFEIITTPFFHLGNKNFKEIQLIVISIEAANMAKQATDITTDLIMITKIKAIIADSKS